MNFQNINQFNNNITNKVNNCNFIQNNLLNYNIRNNQNLSNMQSPNRHIQNNSINLGNMNNCNNINMMINNKNNNVINFNTNKPFQFERRDINNPNINFNINNDYKTKQHKPSYNSVNFNHISDENFSRLNHSSNFITSNNVKNNIWNIPNQFFYQNDISPNNSFVKGSFSDNEIYDNNNNNNNQFLNFNQRKNNYGSFSSHFSHSSSDLLNESYKNEKDYENILSNPDDSIDVNENEDSKNNINSKYILNGLNYGKNDHYFMEKIEETDNFLKELIKEGDLKVENKEFIKKKNF